MANAEQRPDFTHAHVGIVHATAMEVEPFLGRCDRVRKYTGGDLTFRGGLLGDIRIAFAQSGMGPKAAKRGTQALIDGHLGLLDYLAALAASPNFVQRRAP